MSTSSTRPSDNPFFIHQETRRPTDGDSNNHLSRLSSTPSTPEAAAHVNPFSPPGSIRSFSVDVHSLGTPAPPVPVVPRSGVASMRASTQDLPRNPSYYGSSPGISDVPTRTSSGIRLREAFAAPPVRQVTMYSTMNFEASTPVKPVKRLKSTLLEHPSTIDKSWVKDKDTYSRLSYYVTYGAAFLGIIGAAVKCYYGYKSVPVIGNLCMIMDEEFNDNESVFGAGGNWFREVELGGFGNGEFEMTTDSPNNSYVSNGYLYITPTLTSDAIGTANVLNGYTYNLTDCTYNVTNPVSSSSSGNGTTFDATAYYQSCGAVSNSTAGTVINPVQSARISTRNTTSIKYGRVEVSAKLPRGDWFWPAIWMLPVNNTYGPWPLSGEIDIMESRGNPSSYPDQGINYVRGSLNWGPISFLNAVYKTFGWWTQRRADYGQSFHTYALEWTPDFLRIYVDSRLHYMLELSFNEPFFTRGDFPTVVQNGTQDIVLQNPWVNGTNDYILTAFYLILDLAVGGTNGWFPDNAGGKPWLDGSDTAMRDFALAQDTWYSSWAPSVEDRSLVVDYVKMWQLC